jgi:hypothetical protein
MIGDQLERGQFSFRKDSKFNNLSDKDCDCNSEDLAEFDNEDMNKEFEES